MVRGSARVSGLSTVVLLTAMVVFVAAVNRLDRQPRRDAALEMQTALPRFVQVIMAAGDRYLAANIAGFRALVASTENMRDDNFVIQGIVQSDASWLNPAHEDNYYIAAAILPWQGQVKASQFVLRRAADARPFDWQPAFYYAFNQYHFFRDAGGGAEWMARAARTARDENERMGLQEVAAVWIEKGHSPRTAAAIVGGMADSVSKGGFRNYLRARAKRLEALANLGEAATRFNQSRGRPPKSLGELVSEGFISSIPADPLGFGFGLDERGTPVFLSAPKKGPG